MVFSGKFRESSIELFKLFPDSTDRGNLLIERCQNTVKKESFIRKIKTHKITNFLAKIVCFSYD